MGADERVIKNKRAKAHRERLFLAIKEEARIRIKVDIDINIVSYTNLAKKPCSPSLVNN